MTSICYPTAGASIVATTGNLALGQRAVEHLAREGRLGASEQKRSMNGEERLATILLPNCAGLAQTWALKVLEFLSMVFDINPRLNFRLSRPPYGPGNGVSLR